MVTLYSMFNRILRLNLVFLFLVLMSCEQKKKYWLFFKQDTSIDQVRNLLGDANTDLEFYSNWLHAGTAFLSSSQLRYVLGTELIESSSLVSGDLKLSSHNWEEHGDRKGLGFGLRQIEAQAFLDRGLSGKGVKIGVIDGGFLNADQRPDLNHVFGRGHVKAYKDFITPFLSPYMGSNALDDVHGSDVLSNIGGIKVAAKSQLGLAIKADYYLARTDHGKGESISEEEYLVAALEWLDSMEVKLVNISLGYTDGFNNPMNNHKVSEVDGYHTVLTKACQYAAERRGMLLVIAAGNDGDKPWRVLSIPADAPGVLTVGATGYKRWQRASYSSVGPGSLLYIKPNVACFSYNGTSFSAPLITGMAACIWELDSTLTNFQVKTLIEKSGHLFPFGNNHVGYGVPSCQRVLKSLSAEVNTVSPVHSLSKRKITLQLPQEEGDLVIYHKSDSIHVVKQEIVSFKDFKVKLKRYPQSRRVTLSTNRFVKEIIWEN